MSVGEEIFDKVIKSDVGSGHRGDPDALVEVDLLQVLDALKSIHKQL
jgi:hypothetical protein